MQKIEQYYNTIKYLKIRQIQYQCLRRLRKILRRVLRIKYSFTHYKAGRSIALTDYIPKYESCKGDKFTFLNLTEKFDGSWEYKELGALWSFNVNYMEYLLQPSLTLQEGLRWINRFIDTQEGNEIGLSPYCISLRSVNWIKFVTLNRAALAREDIERIDASLYSQYRILLQNIEYNLAGNHLLENFFALLWGAFYFDDEKVFARCASELQEQLNEQTLADGANYEQSPMYHCIILDRLLDGVNLLKNNKFFDGQNELCDALAEKAAAMLGWLRAIVYSDGTYPHFNDSADGVAPTPKQLFDYANRLGIESKKGRSDASGYYCVDNARYELRMDVGGITASYIPGHSHADTFNFELRASGRPFIVDTGISTYQWCARRQYERSTAAHNTIVVANSDSSRVWAAFRLAQRAKVFDVVRGDGWIKATHDGYMRVGVLHSRKFHWRDDKIVLEDTLTNEAEGKAYLHIASGVSAVLDAGRVVTPLAEITFEGATDVRLESCEAACEYNSLKEAAVVIVSFKGSLITNIDILG